jgi:NDP-sugar pyrophosphorylase family protein
MKAMVLAAGMGTRLRPLTDHRPKALLEIGGRTLLEITLSRLRAFGVREVIINVHHFAGMILDFLNANSNFGLRIEVSREEVLLDTGGGLKKAGWFFLEDAERMDEPFLLHNVDVISTIDFRRMVQWHKENGALATLAVQGRETSRYLLFNDQLGLCGRRVSPDHEPELIRSNLPRAPREGTPSPSAETSAHCHSELSEESASREPEAGRSQPSQALAFTGIHVISPRLLTLMNEDGAFSIIDVYLRLAAQGENILGFRADGSYWRDLGKLDQFQQAAEDYQHKLFS